MYHYQVHAHIHISSRFDPESNWTFRSLYSMPRETCATAFSSGPNVIVFLGSWVSRERFPFFSVGPVNARPQRRSQNTMILLMGTPHQRNPTFSETLSTVNQDIRPSFHFQFHVVYYLIFHHSIRVIPIYTYPYRNSEKKT